MTLVEILYYYIIEFSESSSFWNSFSVFGEVIFFKKIFRRVISCYYQYFLNVSAVLFFYEHASFTNNCLSRRLINKCFLKSLKSILLELVVGTNMTIIFVIGYLGLRIFYIKPKLWMYPSFYGFIANFHCSWGYIYFIIVLDISLKIYLITF